MIKTKCVDNFASFYEDNKDFLEERYEEASVLCNTSRPLDIDVNLYQELINLGYVIVLEIYDDEAFVGYCSITISPALLAVGKVDAKVDHLALSKDVRAKGFATEILKQVENFIKDEGADELSIALPPTQLHKQFAEKNGYKESVVMHTKSLRSN